MVLCLIEIKTLDDKVEAFENKILLEHSINHKCNFVDLEMLLN